LQREREQAPGRHIGFFRGEEKKLLPSGDISYIQVTGKREGEK